MTAPEAPTVVQGDGRPVSSCHGSALDVRREVSDWVEFTPVDLWAAGEDEPTTTLAVRYDGRVHTGDSGDYVVRCSQCHTVIEIEVEEL